VEGQACASSFISLVRASIWPWGQGGIIRVTHRRRTVKALRPQLVQRSLEAYPLDKIGTCDEEPAEGDQAAAIIFQQLIRMFAIDAGIQDESPGVVLTEAMDNAVTGERLDVSSSWVDLIGYRTCADPNSLARPHFEDRFERFKQKAGSIFNAAAYGIFADPGPFRDDESRRRALRVIFTHEPHRHVNGIIRPRSGPRRHHDAVGEQKICEQIRLEERLSHVLPVMNSEPVSS